MALCISSVSLLAQVPFDTSGAPTLREIKRWDFPAEVGIRSGLSNIESMCGSNGNDVIVTRRTDFATSTYSQTAPFDTTSVYNWPNGNQTRLLFPIDFDGVAPLEYMNQVGEIFRCSGGLYPDIQIDSIPCLPVPFSSSTNYRCDVDDNGLEDIVVYPSDASVDYAEVVLSGIEFGRGCNRVMSLPRKLGSNGLMHTSTWVRFYRDYDGQLRMLIDRRIGDGDFQGVYLYQVAITQVGSEWSVQYTVTDSIVVVQDQELPLYAQYLECIVRDAKNKHHYAVNQWTRGYRFGKDVLNEPVVSVYIIDAGRFVETEAVVGVLGNFKAHDNAFDSSNAIVTYYSEGDVYYYMSRITDLAKPIGRMPWLITAPYQTFINDQNGDMREDFLIATDHVPGQLRLYDMSTVSTTVDINVDQSDWVTLNGEQLHLRLQLSHSFTCRVSDVLGRVMLSFATVVESSPQMLDIRQRLASIPKGQYFLSVTSDTLQRTFTIIR